MVTNAVMTTSALTFWIVLIESITESNLNRTLQCGECILSKSFGVLVELGYWCLVESSKLASRWR